MAKGSHPPTFAQHGGSRDCAGCGRRLTYAEPLWFVDYPPPRAVYGMCCAALAARHGREKERGSGARSRPSET